MPSITQVMLCFLLLGIQTVGPLPLDQILTGRELLRFNKAPHFRDQAEVFRRAFQRQSKILERAVTRNQLELVLESLQSIQSLSDHACQSLQEAQHKDLRSRPVKSLEIVIRRLIKTLRDFRLSVSFDQRTPFDQTSEKLDELRDRLLSGLFGSDRPREGVGLLGRDQDLFAKVSASLVGTSQRSRGGNRPYGDQFTDDEYQAIQLNQKLVKRVEIFLKIAAARLEEIDRRRQKLEFKGKEENPLEFFTYADLVHAYTRAIEGIMVNIDEKHEYQLATEKEVKQALQKLNKEVLQFAPQVGSLKSLAIELKDEVLYDEVIDAEESTQVALKGSQYGLGAPTQNP